jgi:hypothetical protein
MRKAFEKFITNVWPSVKSFLIEQLRGKAVKIALKAFLKSGAAVGFKAWLIKFVVEELIEEVGIPIINALQVETLYTYDRLTGKVMAKKLNQARRDGDAQEYDNSADDIMS